MSCHVENRSPIKVEILRDSFRDEAFEKSKAAIFSPHLKTDEHANALCPTNFPECQLKDGTVEVDGHPFELVPTVPQDAVEWCMLCGLPFAAFWGKFNCRMCGKVVCTQCSPSQRRIRFNRNPSISYATQIFGYGLQRVDFQCFTKAYNKAFLALQASARDSSIPRSFFAAADDAMIPPINTGPEDDTDENWPAISIAMYAMFKVSVNPNRGNDEELICLVHSRYFRLVNWHRRNCSDDGRVVLTVKWPSA